MKKFLVIVAIMVFYMIVGKVTADTQLIPKEAIRIRVIANSDSDTDQKVKLQLKEQLETYYYDLLKDVRGVEKADQIINESLPEVEKMVATTTQNNDFTIHYGMNYFPEKEYKGVFYEEGYYESLVVNLGQSKGKNWWCVLFPPLCLLENNEMEEVEYRSFVTELIQKYF